MPVETKSVTFVYTSVSSSLIPKVIHFANIDMTKMQIAGHETNVSTSTEWFGLATLTRVNNLSDLVND